MLKHAWPLALLFLTAATNGAEPPPAPAPAGIRLIVRADDMGAAHGVNEACILSYRQGIARSVEVIVPGPWFPDAVRRLKDEPGLDVGVHLCLTSEWERIKWRPLTRAPSLVDADGFFHPMTRQRPDFPPNTSFLGAGPKIDEVEAELRAQIELARKHLPNLTHLSTHMGSATATPELRALTERLGKEYGLVVETTSALRRVGRWSGAALSPEQKEAGLVKLLEELGPGTWLLVEHPGLDTPEMRTMSHKGYENVAADRAGVTRAFTSEKVKEVVRRRGIQLIGYGELRTQ